MTPEQKAAFVMSQSACATAEVFAMQTSNFLAAVNDTKELPFQHADFMAISEKYLIGHNAVIEFFR